MPNREELAEKIDGIGPKYAQQLEEAGIKNIQDLSQMDVEALSKQTGIPAKMLTNWQEQARALTVEAEEVVAEKVEEKPKELKEKIKVPEEKVVYRGISGWWILLLLLIIVVLAITTLSYRSRYLTLSTRIAGEKNRTALNLIFGAKDYMALAKQHIQNKNFGQASEQLTHAAKLIDLAVSIAVDDTYNNIEQLRLSFKDAQKAVASTSNQAAKKLDALMKTINTLVGQK